MDALQQGDVVGPYRLIREAGAGGFSVVWKAEPTGGGDPVALKLPQVPELVEHLRRESALLSELEDPAIPRLIAADLLHDPPYVAFAWVEGKALTPLPAKDKGRVLFAMERARDVALELGRLHDRGVVHGDIKPTNVLIHPETGAPTILDWGLARVQIELRRERTLAQSLVSVDGTSIAGTLEYMAPEVLTGQDPSPASDLFSLGVTLHELLTGQPPAFGVDPCELNPYLTPGLPVLLRSLLHRDPASRVRRAADLVEILRGLIRAERSCLKRKNGRERRRVRQARLRTVARALRGARTALLLVIGVMAIALPLLFGLAFQVEAIGALAIFGGVAFATLGMILGVTTINAFLLRVPERIYKDRAGHPLWTFMMQ
ncbi:MAG: serine/threonine-protein kinase [Planctomycetota bacterium]